MQVVGEGCQVSFFPPIWKMTMMSLSRVCVLNLSWWSASPSTEASPLWPTGCAPIVRSWKEGCARTEDAEEKRPRTLSTYCVPGILLSAVNRVRDGTSPPPWMYCPSQVQLMEPTWLHQTHTDAVLLDLNCGLSDFYIHDHSHASCPAILDIDRGVLVRILEFWDSWVCFWSLPFLS